MTKVFVDLATIQKQNKQFFSVDFVQHKKKKPNIYIYYIINSKFDTFYCYVDDEIVVENYLRVNILKVLDTLSYHVE